MLSDYIHFLYACLFFLDGTSATSTCAHYSHLIRSLSLLRAAPHAYLSWLHSSLHACSSSIWLGMAPYVRGRRGGTCATAPTQAPHHTGQAGGTAERIVTACWRYARAASPRVATPALYAAAHIYRGALSRDIREGRGKAAGMRRVPPNNHLPHILLPYGREGRWRTSTALLRNYALLLLVRQTPMTFSAAGDNRPNLTHRA